MSRPGSSDQHAIRAVNTTEEQRPVEHTSTFDDALSAVAKILHLSQSLIPGLADNPRSLRTARDVSDVFTVYEGCLRALKRDFGAVTDGPGLTNRELEYVHILTRSAMNALPSSEVIETNASLALDRMYAAGASVETFVGSLTASLQQRPSLKATSVEGSRSTVEKFCPAFNAPPLLGAMCFDFESRDALGQFSAPEGSLRSLVLHSTNPNNVTVARGAISPVHGVSGMSGVGKSTALVGLAHDSKIRDNFVDGILYVEVGAAATEKDIALTLSKIMRVTGATWSADEVKSASSLDTAVSDAAIWFNGKCILFPIDDIWPAPSRPEGYFAVLVNLLQGSPDSRMALSSRSRNIAVRTGSHVDFGARDPQGPIAVAMFMSHAAPSIQFVDNHHSALREILARCGGLPIAIAVTGTAVALRMSLGLGFLSACRTYLDLLVEEMHLGASILDSTIRSSLSSLEEMSDKGSQPYTLREMYESLCVLNNQRFAPVSVLSHMWRIDTSSTMDVCMRFSSMSLAKMSAKFLGDKEYCGLLTHDLQQDFCRKTAERRGTYSAWRSRFEMPNKNFLLLMLRSISQKFPDD